MGNLRKHLTKGHPRWTVDDPKNNDGTPSKPGKTSLLPKRGLTKQQQDLISGWLKEADTSPSQVITKAGFLWHFAAWILEDDQAWTTGKFPSLQHLFKYLQIRQELPSVRPGVERLQTGACRVVLVVVSGGVTGLEMGRGI
jgi:hypothetical protein